MSQLNTLLETICAVQMTVAYAPTGSTPGGSITNAFPYPVTDPGISNCPFWENEYLGGPAELSGVQGQMIREGVLMRLLAVPEGGEVTQQAAIQLLAHWRDAVLATFSAHVRLGGGLSWLVQAQITNVGRFNRFLIGDTSFFGEEFTLTVVELFPAAVGQ